jgi:hypothetical protein
MAMASKVSLVDLLVEEQQECTEATWEASADGCELASSVEVHSLEMSVKHYEAWEHSSSLARLVATDRCRGYIAMERC